MIFTKCVAVERGSAVVKNTYLQNVLVLDVVIKLLCRPERAILDNSERALLVPRPDVPGSKGCHLTHTGTVGQQQHFLLKCGPNFSEGDCLLPVWPIFDSGKALPFCQYRLSNPNTEFPFELQLLNILIVRSGENVSSPLCGLLFPLLRNSLLSEII